MATIRRQYYRFLLAFMIVLCAICLALSLWAINGTEAVHAEQTYTQIYAIKKAYLRNTVQNMMHDIDRFRAINRDSAQDGINRLTVDFGRLFRISPARFVELGTELLDRKEYGERLVFRFDADGGRTILRQMPDGVSASDPRFTRVIPLGNYTLRLGVNEEWVDSQAKEIVAAIIHSQSFERDEYIWVNEVKDWSGGDGYAIRRIHPSLPATEGSPLSTKTQDIKGNFPYLTELEGVRDSGEIFSTYYFKRKETDEIAEKLTYATLYKDYDWIIAMGTYIEDVQTYIDAVQRASQKVTARLVFVFVVVICLFFTLALYILSRLERWYLLSASHAYRVESNTDPLTGALNRRLGDQYLGDSFKRFMRNIEDPVLFSFDIDDFKRVNDAYGHDAGDVALKAIVAEVRSNMRTTDLLFRWGGEEFLLLCYGVSHADAQTLAAKINRAIVRSPIAIAKSDAPPTCALDSAFCASGGCDAADVNASCVNANGEVIIHVSVSIGISWFARTDATYGDSLKRADSALYRAKREGKNCARVADPADGENRATPQDTARRPTK